MSSVKRLVRELVDTRRLATGHATSPQMPATSLDNGYIPIKDADGNVVGAIGGDEGALVIENREGPKPPRPVAPTVTADAGFLRVEWNGGFENTIDGEAQIATADMNLVEVHVSQDPNFVPDRVVSFAGAYASLEGGSHAVGPLADAGTYYVRLVGRSTAGKYSEPSEIVEQELAIGGIDLAITDAWLTGDAAATTADGKNSIYRGPDEPVADPDKPFKEGDIWFKTPENKVHFWNGTDWLDARDTAIEEALDKANEALEGASGSGSRNYYQAEMPDETSTPPPSEGDLWFDVSDDNKPYIFQDGGWITARDGYAKIQAGDIIGLRTGTVAPRILSKQWSTPGFEYKLDPVYAYRSEVPAGAPEGTSAVILPIHGLVDSEGTWTAAEEHIASTGKVARFDGAVWFNCPSGTPKVTVLYEIVVAGSAYPATLEVPVVAVSATNRTHEADLGYLTANFGNFLAVYSGWALALRLEVPSVAGNFAQVYQLSGYYQIPSNELADNAITETKISNDAISTPKLKANAITANKISANAITAGKIAANAIETNHIKALSITGDKIAVGAITAESGIIGSIDAGKITVGELNGGIIKSRTILADMLAAGTITADSGVIGSIDANVITVGKIMGNQLDADAINGKTITGAIIRTASVGARVELSQNGLKQYNANNQVITDMSLGKLTLVGDIATDVPGQPRVWMSNLLRGNRPLPDHGFEIAPRITAQSGISATNASGTGISILSGKLAEGSGLSDVGIITGPRAGGEGVVEIFDTGQVTIISSEMHGDRGVTNSKATLYSDGLSLSVYDPDPVSMTAPRVYSQTAATTGAWGITGRQNDASLVGSVKSGHISASPYLEIAVGNGVPNGIAASVTLRHDAYIHSEFAPEGSSSWAMVFGTRTRPSGVGSKFGAIGSPDGMPSEAFGVSAYGSRDLVLGTPNSNGLTFKGSGSANLITKAAGWQWAGIPAGSGTGVNVTSSGWFQKNTSSRRYKSDIKPVDTSGFDVLSLEPMRFVYNDQKRLYSEPESEWGDYEKDTFTQGLPTSFGLIAEDVEAAGGEFIVNYDSEGLPDSLNYGLLAVAYIPILRDLRDRVTELEARLATA